MSKRFRRQDAKLYKKLGTKWRKPKGHQSKLRVKKSGSGMLVRVGYRTKRTERVNVPLISNLNDLDAIKGAARIAGDVGAKTTLAIAEKAGQRGIKILNMKKVKRAEKILEAINSKREMKVTKAEEKKADKEIKATQEAPLAEKKEG